MRRVDLADFWLNLEVDQALAKDRWRKCQADAILLVVDGDATERTGDRDRILAAGKEACGVARQGHQVGLSQAAGNALLFERIDQHVGADARANDAADREPER